MTFEEALERMKYDGARVKRKFWTDAYIFIGKTAGILSDDWEVIK